MDYKASGRRIRSWMVDSGKTIEEVANELGVSPSRLSSWLAGTRRLPLDRADEISAMFGKSIDELACRDKQ